MGKAITVRQFCLRMSIIFQIHCSKLNFNCYTHTPLWSMDAAGKVPHRSPTRPDAGCSIQRSCPRVGATSELFFFFFFFSRIHIDLARFKPIRLLFSPICAELGRFGQNQAVSAKSGYIGRQPKQIKTAEISLESCRNSQNRLWMRPKHPKSVLSQFHSEHLLLLLCFLFCFVFCLCCLPSSFFVLWSRHSNVFFKNILIVKIYRKYK